MTVRTAPSASTSRPARSRRTSSRRALAAVALAGSLVACGNGDDTVASDDAGVEAPTCPFSATEVPPPDDLAVSTDMATKPEVPAGTGDRPTELQYYDVVEGDGEQAETGDAVEVKYVGAFWETGEEFDSSWSRGQDETFSFGVCREGVVPGFSVAPTGMQVGGRRVVVLPPEFAYGAQGSPPTIPADSTLVFVIDLVEVGEEGEDQ